MSEDFTEDRAGTGAPPYLPPAPPPLPIPYQRPPKSPAAATLLSLFPGLGQIYNGQPAKALVFFLAWVAGIAGAKDDPMPFALMIPFVHLFNMVDAWRSATLINARAAGSRRADPEEDAPESPAWGATLVALGVVLLAKNLGWLDIAAVVRFWPLLLIGAGAALLRGSLRRARDPRDGGI